MRHFALLSLGTAGIISSVSASGSAQVETLKVDHPRPLADAVRLFQAQFGWAVTYEDPRYIHPADLVDVTDKVRNPAAVPSGRRVIGPRGGPFAFQFQRPSPDADQNQIAEIVGAMIGDFNLRDYAGKFKIVSTKRMLHVVPMSVRGVSGQQVPAGSILDARVSLPSRQGRATVDALMTLFAAIETSTEQRIEMGTVPTNLLVQSRMDEGATDETARDFLERTLQATGRTLSWRLLYGQDYKRYVLNLTVVKDSARPTP